MFLLETRGLLSDKQDAFRYKRQCDDHLAILENTVQDAFVKRGASPGNIIMLNRIEPSLEIWNFKSLEFMGIGGYSLNFDGNFLSNRSFNVLVGNTVSSQHSQDNGVFQGPL